MAIYQYKGIDKSGKEVKSTINIDSLAAAKQKIKSLGIMLLEIQEHKSDELKKTKTISFNRGINTNELALMTRQLATLIKAKIQIVEALGTLADQMQNQNMKIVLSEVKQKVNEGSSLAKALADYPRVFNNVYVNMVEAGETSGTLDIVLIRLAEFTEAQVRLNNRVKGAMTYPIIMVAFSTIMMGVIFIFVFPKITKIFSSMKKELPILTKISIWISNFLVNYWWAVLVGMFLIYYLTKKYIHTKSGEERYHALLLRLPVVGELVTMVNISRFCSTLATLLHSGVPILTSMTIVKNLVGNVHMQKAILESRAAISEGASITGPLIKSGLFPPIVTHMIKVGEKSGELEPMLKIVSDTFEEQVNTKLAGLTSILEPIMMIGLGIMVAFIVFSVVIPMMQMTGIK